MDRKARTTQETTIDPAIERMTDEIIAANGKVVDDVKAGKERALNSLVGQMMGRIKKENITFPAGAAGVSEILKKKIDERAA
jgi:aspartyl-tRNA(Asn)/glutamyl-tRNA(Gln) amidotransferase subunit B